jgi:hypothetical protein
VEEATFCRKTRINDNEDDVIGLLDWYDYKQDDKVYALIQDADTVNGEGETEINKLADIAACKWHNFQLCSLDVQAGHLPVVKVL